MQLMIRTCRYVTVKKEALARINKAEREGLCVACLQPLGGKRVIRGCHESCKKATDRAILRGETTEDERMREGKLLPAESGGRRPSNPVTLDVRAS